jgi:metal-responsive CopG/Arc/MetJ family transcriptional regulator
MKDKTDKKPSKRMQLVLPWWLADELEKKADELGMNLSEAVREAVREFIKK